MNCFYCTFAGAVSMLVAQGVLSLVCLRFPVREAAADEIGGDV
jgi:hypothetical protein